MREKQQNKERKEKKKKHKKQTKKEQKSKAKNQTKTKTVQKTTRRCARPKNGPALPKKQVRKGFGKGSKEKNKRTGKTILFRERVQGCVLNLRRRFAPQICARQCAADLRGAPCFLSKNKCLINKKQCLTLNL